MNYGDLKAVRIGSDLLSWVNDTLDNLNWATWFMHSELFRWLLAGGHDRELVKHCPHEQQGPLPVPVHAHGTQEYASDNAVDYGAEVKELPCFIYQ